MKKVSVNAIIEDMLRAQPHLTEASDDEFIKAVRERAKANGYKFGGVPKPWNLLRARFAIKAKIAGKNKRHLPKPVINLIGKARQAALEAVASYNNPMSPFRSGSFIVHMHIAWNSMLLGLFMRQGVKPHYLNPKTNRPYLLNGEEKKWDLQTCVREYWGQNDCAISKNIEFFIGLRNKIEHSLMPELDLDIFGECQAHLINFETTLTREFGEEYALLETLAMSLQFSQLRNLNRNQAIRSLHKGLRADVKDYIERFRSALTSDISNDMEYSFKVFLVPNTGNHWSKDSLAVEFVKYDSLNPEEADNYKRVVTLIKDRQVPVANLDKMRAGDVAKRVAVAIKPLEFIASSHHARCWQYFKVRPPKESPQPGNCNPKYCCYDSAHNDYVYTEEWVEFLIRELSVKATYDRICGSKKIS